MQLRRTLSHIFALAVRSIRVEETRWYTPVIRGGICLLIAAIVMTATNAGGRIDKPGVMLMHVVMWPNLAAVTVLGCTMFTASVAEEKESRTLGLLRMADISPLAILFGKAGPRVLSAAILIGLQVPFVLFAVTLGGVTGTEVLRAYVSLLLYITLLASLATFLSTAAATAGRASGILLGMMLLSSVGIFAVGLAIGNAIGWREAELFWAFCWERFAAWTPINTLMRIGYGGQFGLSRGVIPWEQAAFTLPVSLVAIGAAWLLFDRLAMRTPAEGESTWWQRRRMRHAREATQASLDLRDASRSAAERRPVTHPSGSRRPPVATSAARPSVRAWESAIPWKEFRLTAGGKRSILVRFAVYVGLAIVAALLIEGGDDTLEVSGVFMFTIVAVTLPIELLYAASRIFRYEIDSHTWSSLVLLPRSLRSVVGAKVLGALANALPSLMTAAIASLFLVGDVAEFIEDILRDDEAILVVAYILAIAVGSLTLTALYSLFTRYGAIPLTVVSLFAANVLGAIVFAEVLNTREEPFLFVATFFHVILAIVCAELTIQKLGDLAARGE